MQPRHCAQYLHIIAVGMLGRKLLFHSSGHFYTLKKVAHIAFKC
jgi:hypothetical protein